MKKHVLLVEDARDIQFLVRTAIGERVSLTCVETSEAAMKELHSGNYSLILLDVNLPDANGFDLCRRLREEDRFSDVPIFFLTGENELQNKKAGFDSGADDYVTKPFEPEELEARVMAKLKRKPGQIKDKIQVDGYRVDMVQHKIFQRQQDDSEELLPLTPLEFRLLSLFLRHEGKIFSRAELLGLFWGDAVYVSRNTVDTHISSLRKKMGDDGAALKSVFKKGYSFTRRAAKHNAAPANDVDATTKRLHAH